LTAVALQLLTDAKSFGAIINQRLLEPRVLQSLFGSNTVLGVVDKYPLKKVKEQAMECGAGGDEILCGSLTAVV
jgi:hypothetical protein